MASNPAAELASAIQSASINRHPSPAHDINPSTAASKKIPARTTTESPPPRSRSDSLSTDDSIPSEIIRPRPRRKSFPPIPDFRFEQSYLASIKAADTNWKIAFITMRDQVVLPLVQGIAWNLIMFGWRHWNGATKFQGQSLGAKVRKWWWGVNNWKIPNENKEATRREANKVVKTAEDFFVDRFGRPRVNAVWRGQGLRPANHEAHKEADSAGRRYLGAMR
ncbi:hypothetical protein LTR47_009189 [Exophiala xenobiotica]|nr:hypothetical protein LTR41_009879 [Exophiala xenobiotica]KAK5226299.1 hypothetical protein LTR47_009189 [Exophiala xenobiotica]KAK5250418.1 hypothetical protein LTS06_004849 [Exophiala xenobiotica]KAK5351353.1 hypothetical protein LTR61_004702 [Exophiala xenobiotica]KAK5416868.1 hypothetical protein LTR06_002854 [Exophiala xenobiotica]